MSSQEIAVESPLILIVDDDPAVCSSLKFALELEGFVVHTYAHPVTLLNSDDFSRLGCLIIDQKLPGMDGLQLLQRLRHRNITMPAILITSHPSRAVREAADRAGVRIIEKPLLTNALSEGIRDALGSACTASRSCG